MQSRRREPRSHPSLPETGFRRTTAATTTRTTTAVRATAMETSERMIDGSRRLLLAVAATAAAILAVWGGATGASASPEGQPAAFRWLQPQPAPHAWKLARLPSGAASVGYPRSWRPIRTDAGTASVALMGHAKLIRGYLNLTPRQGTETLANWPSFRIEHVGDEEHTKDVRLIASSHVWSQAHARLRSLWALPRPQPGHSRRRQSSARSQAFETTKRPVRVYRAGVISTTRCLVTGCSLSELMSAMPQGTFNSGMYPAAQPDGIS